MRLVSVFFLILISCIISSCGKPENEAPVVQSSEVIDATQSTVKEEAIQPNAPVLAKTAFDLNSIPVSSAEIGEFPFFQAPEGYRYSPSEKRPFDREYFAINGTLTPVEGVSFKAVIDAVSEESGAFSSLQVSAGYKQAILAAGGVKLPTKIVTIEEVNRIGTDELFQRNYGSTLDLNRLDQLETYVIKKPTFEVWIQFTNMDRESGEIAIIQKGEMKIPEVKTITAEKMKSEISATGKAVLNINFDTDTASLKADASPIIDQIYELLNNDMTLKLSIEGHTDNQGAATRNQNLSAERSSAVKDKLVKLGIKPERLSAKGFGATKPLVENSTEANRAKNRRVELVKQG
jgi:OmpA-OmpF porin, OOP family